MIWWVDIKYSASSENFKEMQVKYHVEVLHQTFSNIDQVAVCVYPPEAQECMDSVSKKVNQKVKKLTRFP